MNIFYGSIYGEIDRVILSSTDTSMVVCKNGHQFNLEDVTQEGELYLNGEWVSYFKDDVDLLFLEYIYLILEIIHLNEMTFPCKN